MEKAGQDYVELNNQMARGQYVARPESGHCAGCPYLFICDAA